MRIDSLPLLRKDSGQVGASLARLGDQLRDGWEQARGFSVPSDYREVENAAVLGMGGSHLGADIVRSVWAHELPGPVTIVADYTLPAWINRKTLVIASSYSGGTEETLEAMKAAVKRRLPIVVITSGGKLADAARYYRLPMIQFTPTANPSNQPRLGLGYSLSAFLKVFSAIGWIKKGSLSIEAMAVAAQKAEKKYGAHVVESKNPAKQLAKDMVGRLPILIGSEWMAGNLHTFTNQIHENAKTYAAWYLLPDINHHLLEGLRNRAVTRQVQVVFFQHAGVHQRTQIRLRLTERIIRKLGAKTSIVRLQSEPAQAAIELLTFGGYVSWYLAAIRRVQPAPIPTVDELKQALGRYR